MALNKENVQIKGCDVFIIHKMGELPPMPESSGDLQLKVVSNRGTKVWPGEAPNIHLTDHFRCRYVKSSGEGLSTSEVSELLSSIENAGMDWVHIEKLLTIDGVDGFSKIQGE